ncbi:hypothetical protein PoB_006999600 [Plakobranchus ocellatus]|uniref:Uncharacterized protein n=1 Tax=Plakobranchus ocellatus TaxID=259542 RepID=A0AAV4DH39_9GAST|nr:hypothetical protein PoB_006999600 [Plakobranchus ocellatus]
MSWAWTPHMLYCDEDSGLIVRAIRQPDGHGTDLPGFHVPAGLDIGPLLPVISRLVETWTTANSGDKSAVLNQWLEQVHKPTKTTCQKLKGNILVMQTFGADRPLIKTDISVRRIFCRPHFVDLIWNPQYSTSSSPLSHSPVCSSQDHVDKLTLAQSFVAPHRLPSTADTEGGHAPVRDTSLYHLSPALSSLDRGSLGGKAILRRP